MRAKAKQRIDILLFSRLLAPSREKARAFIMAGEVYVDGKRVTKVGTLVSAYSLIEVRPRRPLYVGRGGEKLKKAIDEFGIDVKGAIALDVGASTGGFTDCLLREGASRVYAVDVGKGQLDLSLREDQRVVNLEGHHALHLSDKEIPEKVDIITVDVSFISAVRVVGHVEQFLKPDGAVVLLIKPQFEAGKGMTKKGVVRDKTQHAELIEKTIRNVESLGLMCAALTFSPIKGPKGNIEFLALFHRRESGPAPRARNAATTFDIYQSIPEIVEAAHAESKR